MIVHEKDASSHRCCVPGCGKTKYDLVRFKAPHPNNAIQTVDAAANVQIRMCEGAACMGWVWTNGSSEASGHKGYCGVKPVSDPIPLS